MAKRTDYSNFIEFARQHQNLSSNKIIEAYRATGGHVQKQQGLKVLRESFGYEKGEKKNQPLFSKKDETKAKAYQAPVKTVNPKPTVKRQSNFLTLDKHDKKNLNYTQAKNNGIENRNVKKLQENIKALYGTNSNEYVQVHMSIDKDGYTQNKNFSVMYPYNGRTKQGVKATAQHIIDNLKTYYTNLAKMYKNDKTKETMKDDMLLNLKGVQSDLNKARNMSPADFNNLFDRHGIHLGRTLLFRLEED